ncbi:type II toxin-antitoxin system RelE family toxin [Methanobrevibacter sp.]|uniref:type II toxin-antitoxin system RelE family toxin n=1 Tax=Methanobrevibacter sp. TaxID=66852 RepID=UPI00388EEF23
MNKYNIQIIAPCQKFLDDLKEYNLPIHTQLCDTIREVISNPFNSKFKRLRNSDRDRRARSGDFRIVFFVSNNTILITKIGLRKNVYKMDVGCPKLSKKQLRSL